jgi:hypothetical protein
MNKSENKPINKIVKGNIVLDVWLNEAKNKLGELVSIPNITLKRTYKDDKTGQWKSTTNYRSKDIPNIECAIVELKEYLTSTNIKFQ